MSVVKRRMELQEEFSVLEQQERGGKPGILARQFLRTLPVICNPNLSRPRVITVGQVLTIVRDVLRHAVHKVFDDLPFDNILGQLKWEVELSVAHPATLATFNANPDLASDFNDDLFLLPLFGDLDGADSFLGSVNPIRGFFSQLDTFGGGRFWRDWYQGFLNGRPLDWELQRRVALIPDEDWEKGPAHIAEKIEEIEAAYLAEKLPQAETVAFDEAEGKFFTVPVPVAKPDLLGATLSQLEDALDDAMANPSNGLGERSRETRVLRRVVSKYGNDPQRIEMDLTSVHAGLTRQIVSGELPPSEENLALQSACEEGVRAVRGTHPEIAENRRILTEQAMLELSPQEKATLEDALPVLQAISRDDLAEEWGQDISALINDATGPVPDTAPRLPGADEVTRIFSRAAKISIWLRMGKVIHVIDGSAGYKAARIVGTIGGLVSIGLAILSLIS